MSELAIDDKTGKKLLDVLKREEKAVLSGEWHKLAPLDRLRTRLWRVVGSQYDRLSEPLLRALRDQSELNSRLLAKVLGEVGEQISGHRRRAHVSHVYRQIGTPLA
jgi:hypothetical protein